MTSDDTAVDSPIPRIIASFDHGIIRAYSNVRFLILRQSFLEEIDQYLPTDGRVLDLGCGFGLFSLYFASTQSKRNLVGIDLSDRRVQLAKRSADRLQLFNVSYETANVLDWRSDCSYDAVYMLDVVHHLPQEDVPEFLRKIRDLIRPGGRLILKDVSDKPRAKMLFTLLLDRLMVGMKEPIRYWPPRELTLLLENLGFEVKRHTIKDVLPYPHVLYICKLR